MLAWLVLIGCQNINAGPMIEAHRGGAGYWPQNSRMAMDGVIGGDFEAVEFDLVLTSDGAPVLSHDPWVHRDLCTEIDGAPVKKEILIQDLTLEELQSGWLCGGEPDADFPQAHVNAESVMSFDELLLALKGRNSYLLAHIDLKYEPGLTAAPEVFAEQVFSRWFAADLPNPFYATANSPEVIAAVEAYGRDNNRDITTSLVWPRFPPGDSTLAVALKAERDIMLGLTDYVSLAHEADADGLAVYFEAADKRQIQIAKDNGLQIQLWTLNDPEALDYYAAWPVDALITDYPGDYP